MRSSRAKFETRSVVLLLGGDSSISLGDEGKSDTVELGELNQRLSALSDGEDVGQTGGEGVAISVSDVDDLVGTRVLLNGGESADTTDIVSASDEHLGSILKFDNSVDLASLKVQLSTSRTIVLNIIQFWKRKESAH